MTCSPVTPASSLFPHISVVQADDFGQDSVIDIIDIDRECRNNIEGLESVESEGKRCDHRDSENNTEPAGVQGALYVIGGAAFKGIAFFFLVNLREGTFYERGRGSQNRHEPHPESRAGTSHNDSRGNACHIACTDTGRCGNLS